ncbi:unnamed protein product [Ectocarpus sp. 12 AP-2014]
MMVLAMKRWAGVVFALKRVEKWRARKYLSHLLRSEAGHRSLRISLASPMMIVVPRVLLLLPVVVMTPVLEGSPGSPGSPAEVASVTVTKEFRGTWMVGQGFEATSGRVKRGRRCLALIRQKGDRGRRKTIGETLVLLLRRRCTLLFTGRDRGMKEVCRGVGIS